MLLSCDESLIRILDESHDEYGSKAEESDSRVGFLHADSGSIGWLLPLKISGPHSESRIFSKIYSERLSPAQPVSRETQPVATLGCETMDR